MAKFQMQERILEGDKQSARLANGTGAANVFTDADVGKAVKLVGDSQYNLCAVGDGIEGFVVSMEAATLDNYSFGTVMVGGRKEVLADGLQATPGTGVLAVGDFVLASTPVARNTALADPSSQKVVKSTFQPFSAEAAALTDVNDMIKATLWAWRVVSLGSAGTGAVGTKVVIERVK
jgi:hypothetical protein